jgi:hypothetical protein
MVNGISRHDGVIADPEPNPDSKWQRCSLPFLHRYDNQLSLLVKLLDLCYYAEARR